ncbi:MAG TPA: hypothetical protein DIS96_14575 [Pusillimonas sp.]|nr:hypothetical protein [Pusillimonas sp.]
MPILIDGEELSPFDFYLRQMERAIEVFETGRLADIGLPVLSFFSGKEQHQPAAAISPIHIFVFTEDKQMQLAIESAPQLFIKWTEVLYFYFLEMAAFPREAKGVWSCCWKILDMFERSNSTFAARCQMAAWAAAYDNDFTDLACRYLKTVRLLSAKDQATRSLILSSRINQGQSDQREHVEKALALSPHLPHIHKLQAYINYYCQADSSYKVLTWIISALNWHELAYIREGKIGLLEPVIWTLQHKNNYNDLLFLLRCLRMDIRQEGFKSGHAFILPNIHNAFIALKANERIQFSTEGNGDNYARLIRLCNKLNGVAISMRGEEELGSAVEKFDDFGKPTQEDAFDALRLAVIEHYHLQDDFFKEVSLLTLVPSHNHPVQGALCSLGVMPPFLSTSLQDVVDESVDKNFVFFLAESTYTVELESQWIKGAFGDSAEIRINPKPDDVIAALNDQRLTHIYISAHGKFDHWEREPDKIHFSNSSEVAVDELLKTQSNWDSRKTLILNLCDGAATRVSYNPHNSGMAAALASGSQVVVSHLWPVDPKYAAVFGLFLLDRLLAGLVCQEAVLKVYQTLSRDNSAIASSAREMGEFSEDLAKMIENTEFRFSDFRNIGAVAIYV